MLILFVIAFCCMEFDEEELEQIVFLPHQSESIQVLSHEMRAELIRSEDCDADFEQKNIGEDNAVNFESPEGQ